MKIGKGVFHFRFTDFFVICPPMVMDFDDFFFEFYLVSFKIYLLVIFFLILRIKIPFERTQTLKKIGDGHL
jgi:hypothetical protein